MTDQSPGLILCSAVVQNPRLYVPQLQHVDSDALGDYSTLFATVKNFYLSELQHGKDVEFSVSTLTMLDSALSLRVSPEIIEQIGRQPVECDDVFQALASVHPFMKTHSEMVQCRNTVDWISHVDSRALASPSEGPISLTCAADVEVKELQWFWECRFPRNHISIVSGPPGLGKSMIAVDMAARSSTGSKWPDGSRCEQCEVVYSTTEDGYADTVAPRLRAAGADLRQIHFVDGVPSGEGETDSLSLDLHCDRLDELFLKNPRIGLLIVDTLQSHVGAAINSNNNSSMRRALSPLKRLCEKHSVTCIIIEHTVKARASHGDSAAMRVGGSVAIVAAARSVWVVCPDHDDDTGKRRYLQSAKSNLAPDNAGIGLCYQIEGPAGRPVIRWLETDVSISANDLIVAPDRSSDGDGVSELDRCCDWLIEHLTGPISVAELKRDAADGGGFSAITLRRAKERLRIETIKIGSEWKWFPTAEMTSDRNRRKLDTYESDPSCSS